MPFYEFLVANLRIIRRMQNFFPKKFHLSPKILRNATPPAFVNSLNTSPVLLNLKFTTTVSKLLPIGIWSCVQERKSNNLPLNTNNQERKSNFQPLNTTRCPGPQHFVT